MCEFFTETEVRRYIVDDTSNALVSTDAQEFCDFTKNPNKIKQNFNQSITLKAMIMKSSLEYMEYLLILSKITPVGPSSLYYLSHSPKDNR